jgi:hypothetical protein
MGNFFEKIRQKSVRETTAIRQRREVLVPNAAKRQPQERGLRLYRPERVPKVGFKL